MKLNVPAGKYVVAVSGGVDSVVLLDVLTKQPNLQLTVAHFDHGIRESSSEDREFVGALAKKYGLLFEFGEENLGSKASEATARAARYSFLKAVQKRVKAQAIIVAHHQDDLLETAVLNMLRGTGRKGLTSLQSRPGLLRPMLSVRKTDIISYAQGHDLAWREDVTNQDTTYLRNYIRHKLLPRLSDAERSRFLNNVTNLTSTNVELDELLADILRTADNQLDRQWFNQLPHSVAREVMAAWLRANDRAGFDRQTLERLVVSAKTGRAGKQFPAQAGLKLQVERDHLALVMV